MNTITFQHSDAWILLSIFLDDRGSNLEELIAAADCINHAIPDHSEIEGAVNRALQAGIIELHEGRFRYTGACRGEFEILAKRFRYVMDTWEAFEAHLKSKPWPVLNRVTFSLSPGDVDEAYEAYVKSIRKRTKKRKKKE
jgi:hypothetical protein